MIYQSSDNGEVINPKNDGKQKHMRGKKWKQLVRERPTNFTWVYGGQCYSKEKKEHGRCIRYTIECNKKVWLEGGIRACVSAKQEHEDDRH